MSFFSLSSTLTNDGLLLKLSIVPLNRLAYPVKKGHQHAVLDWRHSLADPSQVKCHRLDVCVLSATKA